MSSERDGWGQLFIVSGPSGAGKSALAAALLQTIPGIRFSVSYTTRRPRRFERDGVEYHFVSHETFERLIEEGEFLEWAEVYGNLYGTSKTKVDAILALGSDVLLDVDVQGARSIRSRRPEAVSVFIMPPSFQILKERLESRRLDEDRVIEQRLKVAAGEITQYREYDYIIINHDLSRSTEEMRAIVVSCRCRMEHRATEAQGIVASFGGVNAEATGKY